MAQLTATQLSQLQQDIYNNSIFGVLSGDISDIRLRTNKPIVYTEQQLDWAIMFDRALLIYENSIGERMVMDGGNFIRQQVFPENPFTYIDVYYRFHSRVAAVHVISEDRECLIDMDQMPTGIRNPDTFHIKPTGYTLMNVGGELIDFLEDYDVDTLEDSITSF